MIFEGLDRIKRNVIMSTIVLMIAGNLLLVIPDDLLPYFS